MEESDERTSDVGADRDMQIDLETIDLLVAKLAGNNGRERERARWALVDIGSPTVPPLLDMLRARKKQVRWEAAKALAAIADPAAAEALVTALEDKVFDVRWLAAEGLINIGRAGLVPLLHALIERSDSPWLRQGAHHVLHDLAVGDLKEMLKPVVDSLQDVDSAVETPVAAKAILDRLVSEQADNR
jgi:HEAT repeat protein